MPRRRAPVLIQRELLLAEGQPDPEALERVVGFQREGHHLLLVAEQPSGWGPTRRSVDRDLALQQDLQQRIGRAGAELDGVIYLETGLFARKRSRLKEIDELAERYQIAAADLVFIGREPVLLESVILCGGKSLAVNSPGTGGSVPFDTLQAALSSLSSD